MIILKSPQEIEIMGEANRIVHEALDLAERLVESGITTAEIDAEVESLILKQGALPAFKGYRGFPNTACISVNDEIVHGIPNSRKLKEGDVVSVDVGTNFKGYFGDAARTFIVGKAAHYEHERLVKKTKEVLDKTVDFLNVWQESQFCVQDVCRYLSAGAKLNRFTVPKNLGGHGIGKALHDDPFIPNYVDTQLPNYKLRAGMVLAIEPMFCLGSSDFVVCPDGWTIRTKDGSFAAHWEYSIALTADGAKILGK